MKCGDCRFWRALPGGAFDEGFGNCHRRAPSPTFENIMAAAVLRLEPDRGGDELPSTPSFDFFVRWPLTDSTQFCGEFEPAAESDRYVHQAGLREAP